MLYPGYSAEDDYPLLEQALGDVSLLVEHTSVGEDAHRVDALLDLGGPERLAQGAEALRRHHVDAAVWACTSGSFVFGWKGAHAQADAVGRRLGVPASSTSLAFARATRALDIDRVAVAATYPDDVTAAFVDFLAAGGIEVVRRTSHGIITAAEVGTLGRDAVLELATANDHPDAAALLLPDTALHTIAWLEDLEAAVGKPVLTANQVTAWEGLRLLGNTASRDGLGSLFRSAATKTHLPVPY
ncbi:MAG TPA: maleate cis-trans isomerase [Nocardioidaceae bacterium]|nr:maleate cis-trans isomerase [Nocardioidaceae bacterium]